MGRPRKKIDPEAVRRMAALGCTQDEIADVLGCDQATISKRFSSEFACARARWKTSLRRAQTIRAVNDRSDAMLIHLGKVYLGQAATGDGGALDDILDGVLAGGEDPADPGEVPG